MNILNQIFSKVTPLPVGTHHMQSMQDEKPYRLHLRLQKDGSGLLILNAATVMQLNPTAAECAFHYIKGSSPEEAAKQISARYRVDRKTALADFNNFADRIHDLISTPDLDPASFLDFERVQPHSTDSTLRLDCALTYKLPANNHTEYAPVKRVDRELTTQEWQTILDKAWQAGIPHIIFTGGEATLRDDLPQLIAHAEKNGQVCGLLTDGLKLANKEYLELLLQTGLDHVMVILQPDQPRSWEAIEIIIPQDLFLTVHLTLNKENVSEAKNILQKLAELGVENISLSTSESDLLDDLLELQGTANSLGLAIRWDLPVPYSASHPVAFETVDEEIPDGAGKTWMYVEPDGDVLPAQGEADKILGNFLRDTWESISK
ncbi:PqqD family peptide modification chaperone [Candidatus Villigracilis saccharophilus]|uniref:radical SAM protein n=1 Tax=Candidatus Villigracilis saccharophilus TaxID=3140684 RepID=UPI003136F53D|nr:radical SAM protein [Anaerolineales bacterium]